MNHRLMLWRRNCKFARLMWGQLGYETRRQLKFLTIKYHLSLERGELQLLNNRWHVTHIGLLGIAQRKKCVGIKTSVLCSLSDAAGRRWVFRAVVYRSSESGPFVGYGDADPSNVSPLVRGAEMRVAETRAVNRALRKAYGIGLCSVEELGYLTSRPEPPTDTVPIRTHSNGNSSGNGQPRLRDRLCLLIRQHQLDPSLVKLYAADFCGTQELREAKRDVVESFVTHLAEWAAKDRDGLICKLNSYAQSQEARS